MLIRLLVLSAVLVSSVSAQTSLTRGLGAERSLASDGRDVFTLEADAGQFVSGAADQRSVDVVISILGPDGAEIENIDVSGRGDDQFHFVTEEAGIYTFVVTPFEEAAGVYAMRLDRFEAEATLPEGIVTQRLSYRDGPNAPGAVVGVIDGGELVFTKAMGQANLTYGIPYTVDTPTNIGSTSKQFTAFAIGLLAEQGKLNLDDDVRTYLPELPEFEHVVTLRHLLTHTSGYREFLNTLYVAGRQLDDGDYIDREEIIAMVQRQPNLQNVPGAEFNYNNTGYTLLATVVERVTGEDFPDWMAENVFEPVGMTHTVVRPNATTIVRDRAIGYAAGAGGWAEVSDIAYSMGAGGIYSTVGDLARWMQNLMTGAYGGDVITQMTMPSLLNDGKESGYGLGLFIDSMGPLKRIHHGGADSAHRAMFAMFPDEQRGVIVLTNSDDDSAGIAAGLARAFYGEEFGRPASVEESDSAPSDSPVSLDPAIFESFAGRYALDAAPDFILTFRGDGEGGFFTQATGQPEFPIFPTSDSTFVLRVVDASVTFHREADGIVRSATLHQGGANRATRLDLEDAPPAPELSDFVGRFVSDELEATYTLRVEEGVLIVNHRRSGDVELAHRSGDTFGGGPMTVAFERDASDAVTAFVVDAGRTRGIRFDRR